jgi:hypothetical protein
MEDGWELRRFEFGWFLVAENSFSSIARATDSDLIKFKGSVV